MLSLHSYLVTRFTFRLAQYVVVSNLLSLAWSQSASLPLTRYSAYPVLGRYLSDGASLQADKAGFEDKEKTFYPNQIEDPGVQQSKESLRLTIIDTVGAADPFFKDNNHLVVVADVMSSRVYLAAHKRAVYRAHRLNVVTTISNRDSIFASPTANDKLEVFQLGGSILFPSGHIKHFLIHDQGMLGVGNRYVLFLWHDKGLASSYYELTGAYLLNGDRIFSLRDDWPYNFQNGKSLKSFEDEVLADYAN